MIIFHTISELRFHLAAQRKAGRTISFVSTMGALHAGHVSLVEYGKTLADLTVTGIFLNPSHFAAGEDFDIYPRTLEKDCDKLRNAGCDIVFAPPSVKYIQTD
ncbi:pantoate--beta-alanine ligase [Pseudomonas syringae]|nr:pantoate--beta-alanine ligase [Pseudomonas syringae]